MKIKKIKLNNHPVLKNLEFNFSNTDGNASDLIIIAGTNGSGKTNLLESIYNFFLNGQFNPQSTIEWEFTILEEETRKKYPNDSIFFSHLFDFQYWKAKPNVFVKDLNSLPKIIYLPVQINFNEIPKATPGYKYSYSILNKLDTNIIMQISSYLSTKVTLALKKHGDLTYSNAVKSVIYEVNDIFKILELDVKMIGFSEDEKDLPLFANSLNEFFDINKLSSGEKQLFLRILSLKMIEADNSIILIDEPEISLHPKWQQKIVKIYEKIGLNNQIIIATHSPNIIGSVTNDKIKIMKRTENGIEFLDYSEQTYGQTIETILEDVMDLPTSIDPDIHDKIICLKNMIQNKLFNTDEFKTKYSELKNILGTHNENILLLNIELNRIKNQEVAHAQSK